MATRSAKDKDKASATLALRAVEEGSAQALLTSGDDVTLRSARRVRVGAASRDAAGAASQIDVRPDDAVCVEYENGVRLWMRADDLLRERGRPAATRGHEAPAWEIDVAPRLGSARDDQAGASCLSLPVEHARSLLILLKAQLAELEPRKGRSQR
mgnify:CR=1 FL=1